MLEDRKKKYIDEIWLFCFALTLLSQLYSRICLSSNINRRKARAGWEAAEDKSKFQGYNLENNTTFANNIAH